jgi:photosystem II stability/assembly factor-like uncharacterized protein
MQRREFLRSTTAIALATAGGVALGGMAGESSAEAATSRTRFRGTRHGKILITKDGGQTWRLLTNLGSKLDVRRVREAGARVTTRAVFGHHGSFTLVLQPDGHTWRTA